jgi:hypothetical protein
MLISIQEDHDELVSDNPLGSQYCQLTENNCKLTNVDAVSEVNAAQFSAVVRPSQEHQEVANTPSTPSPQTTRKQSRTHWGYNKASSPPQQNGFDSSRGKPRLPPPVHKIDKSA